PWVSIFMFKMKQFLTPCTNYNLLTEIFFVLSVKILLNKSHLLANFFLSVNYNLCMALKIASF
ncbi:hypothetical protein ACI3PF_22270, partial [Lactococcus lactis]